MTSLKRKLIKLAKENLQLRQDCLKRSLDWTGENGNCEMLILHAAPIPEMELYQANQLTDQT